MDKNALKSKTLWTNAILALLAIFYPPATAFITAHPEVAAGVFGAINMGLRFVTKGAVTLS